MSERRCDRCRKGQATLHVTKVEGGKVRERHLCPDCARVSPEDFSLPVTAWEPPAEDWLSETDKRRLVCRSCRHVNPDDWNFCSACGAMREP